MKRFVYDNYAAPRAFCFLIGDDDGVAVPVPDVGEDRLVVQRVAITRVVALEAALGLKKEETFEDRTHVRKKITRGKPATITRFLHAKSTYAILGNAIQTLNRRSATEYGSGSTGGDWAGKISK